MAPGPRSSLSKIKPGLPTCKSWVEWVHGASWFFAGFAALFAVALQPSALWAQDDDPTQSLIGKYCLGCHNDNLLTAGVSFQGLDPANVGTDTAVWEKVLRKITLGEMPPAGVSAPEASDSAKFVARLEEALDAAAAAAPNPGRPLAHRLNRVEYSNAIRDLLAVDINAGAMLPADDSGYGFDNIADVLSLSPALLERYLVTARRISRLATGNPNVKPQKEIFQRNRETGFLHAGHKPGSRQDLPFGADRGAALRYYFPLDGEYVISLEARADGTFTRAEYESHELRRPVKAGLRTLAFTLLGESSRPERARPLQDAPAGNALPDQRYRTRLPIVFLSMEQPSGRRATEPRRAAAFARPLGARKAGAPHARRSSFPSAR